MSAVDTFAAINTANATATSATGSSASSSAAMAKTAADSADRFLKLLVTQMQNQDPLNPMDNAQVTSQMAQISTVSGIEKLNNSVAGLDGQFVKMQALQGAAMVGRDVTLQGNRLDIADGQGTGGFDLASPADKVTVEILNGAGRVVDTLQLGAATVGRHEFTWPASSATAAEDYRFRVSASNAGSKLTPTALMRDRVLAVDLGGEGLELQTAHSGSIAYSAIKSLN
ncbi:Flagellar basal-body rod modification protein FlgD [Rubrivivax sp. A210]|uniref:flagellar hook assembly protein FlgD n=1 Tax=Rubrivivax sp. A210 TaxID=2772301 RepID=UPI00191A72B5|nr:flagellar hook capping FlgD N-terminal domain-containing protein [Rubrivivax sp. A210]CAD5374747.1 Flagellar basal-body rod modification protein FlgD [Rubrivivax sp. A210]